METGQRGDKKTDGRVSVCCLLNHASFNEAGTEDILSQTQNRAQGATPILEPITPAHVKTEESKKQKEIPLLSDVARGLGRER